MVRLGPSLTYALKVTLPTSLTSQKESGKLQGLQMWGNFLVHIVVLQQQINATSKAGKGCAQILE